MSIDSLSQDLVELFESETSEVTIEEVQTRSRLNHRAPGVVRSVGLATAIFILVLGVGIVVGWLAGTGPDNPRITIPPEPAASTSATEDPDPDQDSRIQLGTTFLWTTPGRIESASDLAENFATEVLGWESPNIEEFGHADRKTWVWIGDTTDEGRRVDLLVAEQETGFVVLEAGLPRGHGVRLDSGVGAVIVEPMRIGGAVNVEIVLRRSDGTHLVERREIDAAVVDSQRLELTGESMETTDSILVLHEDASGRVIGAAGTSDIAVSSESPRESSAGQVYLDEGQTLLAMNPTVVQGALSPEPRFDTSDLGEEVTLEPMTDVAEILTVAERIAYPHERLVRVTALGTTPGGVEVVISHGEYFDQDMGGQVQQRCLLAGCSVEPVQQAAEYPGGILPALPASGSPGRSASPDGTGHIWLKVTPETSVVAYVASDRRTWQRPVGDVVVFDHYGGSPFDELSNPFELTLYESDGDVIDTYSSREDCPIDPEEEFDCP